MITPLLVWIRFASPCSFAALTLTRCQVASGSLAHPDNKTRINSKIFLYLLILKARLVPDKITRLFEIKRWYLMFLARLLTGARLSFER